MAITVLCVIALAVYNLALAAAECTKIKAKDSEANKCYEFDVTELQATHSFTDTREGDSFFVSPCQVVDAPSGFNCASNSGGKSDSGYQVQGSTFDCYAMGEVSKVEYTWSGKGGDADLGALTIQYSGGADDRKMQIEIQCSQEADVMPTTCDESTKKTYKFIYKSKSGCPDATIPCSSVPGGGGGGGLSGVQIVVILMFTVPIVALISGSVFRWKVKGETGTDVIPAKDTLMDIPFLVKDGLSFTASGADPGGAPGGPTRTGAA